MLSKTRKVFPPLFALVAGLLMAGLVPAAAYAADADAQANPKSQAPIVVNLKQFKVLTDDKGQSRLTDASLVVPGDMLEYQATYTNRSANVLAVVATLPVPEAVEYIKDSARSTPAIAHAVALKDSQFGPEPLLRKVVNASGSTLMQPVPYAEYRFVHWDLGKLAAGGSVLVSIRAKVAQNPDTPTAGQ